MFLMFPIAAVTVMLVYYIGILLTKANWYLQGYCRCWTGLLCHCEICSLQTSFDDVSLRFLRLLTSVLPMLAVLLVAESTRYDVSFALNMLKVLSVLGSPLLTRV